VTLPKTKEVLGVVELVEKILSFLQPKEITSCRKLSTKFRNTIDASPLLQELMFLRTTHVPQQSWRLAKRVNGHGKGLTGIRPIVGLQPQPWWYFVPFHVSRLTPRKIRTPAVLNPTFGPSPLFESRERDPDAYNSGTHCDHITLSPNYPGLKYSQKQDFKPNWTVLDMYLTNPPCLEAFIHFEALRLPSRYCNFTWVGLLIVPTGITVRDILNAPSSVIGHGCYFQSESPEELHDYIEDVNLDEIWESMFRDGDGDPFAPYGELRCDFLDTTIPTDRMWAGVASYAEADGEPKYSPETEEDWRSKSNESSDDEDDGDADEESNSESDSEEADDEDSDSEEVAENEEIAENEKVAENKQVAENGQAEKRQRAKMRRAEKRRAKRRKAKRRTRK
jgi:hypothetical protein